MKRNLHSEKNLSGSVLIVVLIVCLALVSLTVVLAHTMMMAYRGSDNDLAGRQAEMAEEAGAQYAESVMANVPEPGQMPDPTTYMCEASPVGEANFWFIGEPDPTDTSNTVTFGLVDEASKLNLNTATAAMLENLPGMTTDLATAIVAWRTSGTSSSTGGSSTSSSNGSMANVKGAPFESVEELAQVDGGIPMETLYGNDMNLNHVFDPNEAATGATTYSPGLLEYVTVYSRISNTTTSGSSRINVTTTSGSLTSLVTGIFGSNRGGQINTTLQGAGAVNSVLEFYLKSGMTADEFGQISPYLTATNAAYSVGLINVNTASATVLECVPGITQSIASQIVSTRSNQTETSGTTPPNLAWVAPLLTGSAAAQAGPYLTAETYQVSADVAAVGRHGRGYRRTLYVIDGSNGSTSTPQIVYRRDLTSLGWALGSAERQALAKQDVSP